MENRQWFSRGAVLSTLLLGGCATGIAQGGFDEANKITSGRLGTDAVWIQTDDQARAARKRTQTLLSQPLTPDAAVEIALLNNRGLQSKLAMLGIGAADLAQSRLPPAPGFTYSRKKGDDDLEIERTITFNILGFLTLPFRAGIEQRTFEQTKLSVANDILRTAADARRAYFQAIAAQQTVDFVNQAMTVTGARAEFARRMAEVGNFSALDYVREQAFYAETAVLRARARLNAMSARERLVRQLGLSGPDLALKLPDRLPDMPATPEELTNAEGDAVANRLDIRMAKADVDERAASLGLTQGTRFINVLEGGYISNHQTGQPRRTGYEVTLEVPIFDLGEANVTRAQAVYLRSVNRLAEAAINARSEVRETYASYRTSFDLAKQYHDEILPMRQRISEEVGYRYGGMLISVFELLSDARDQIASATAAIASQRDFWIADTNLRFVTIADTGNSGEAGDSIASTAGSLSAGIQN